MSSASPMMTFLWPTMLWAMVALPVIVLLYVFLITRRKKTSLRYANLGLVKEALGSRSAWRRHVPPVLLFLALATLLFASSRLSVGACTTAAVPANETTAILTFLGRSATKALAASWAATSRFGWTSAARMLPETSIARTIVSCADGKVINAAGRDDANSSVARARKRSTGGTWRRQALRLPSASLTRPMLA